MRMHIVVDDDLVRRLDERVGRGGRSRFVVEAVRRALADEQRWDSLESALGSVAEDHEWDADPAAWVREQRSTDARRTG